MTFRRKSEELVSRLTQHRLVIHVDFSICNTLELLCQSLPSWSRNTEVERHRLPLLVVSQPWRGRRHIDCTRQVSFVDFPAMLSGVVAPRVQENRTIRRIFNRSTFVLHELFNFARRVHAKSRRQNVATLEHCLCSKNSPIPCETARRHIRNFTSPISSMHYRKECVLRLIRSVN